MHNIEAISALKKNPAQLVAQVNASRRPLYVTQNGRATAVLQDVHSFEENQRTLAMLRLVALGEAEAESADCLSHDEAMAAFAAHIDALQSKSR
ncbi:MAG: type II toxin-antitoxin system Phd/YefM family antitoxin [Polyangiales bacterium]